MKREFNLAGLFVLGCSFCLYSANVNVTNNNDSGTGSLRAAIEQINSGTDGSNTITMQIPGNSPISLSSDLPVIKKNTVINSTGKQPIDGNGKYRLFATIMADLSLTNCNLQNGAAIGGDGGSGGMGAGGGVYIDRGNTLILTNLMIASCKAQGGRGGKQGGGGGGGGASFSTSNKNSNKTGGGGDYPGLEGHDGEGGAADGSKFLTGYGGGKGGRNGGNPRGSGPGQDAFGSKGGDGGYCGGGGGSDYDNDANPASGGGGGNKGGKGYSQGGGGGGFGSGGGEIWGGGGFGGGASGASGGGGFGGGGGTASIDSTPGKGGHFGGDGIACRSGNDGGGGGAGLGGAIFVGDTATCLIQDKVTISKNGVVGGEGSNHGGKPGQGYAPDIFLFRKAKVVFDNQQPLSATYSIMADLEAPTGHLDNGVVKQGPGQLTLSNTNNNYRGGTSIEDGTLSVTDPKTLGSQTSIITLNGGALQPTKTMTIANPIVSNGTGGIDIPAGTTLTTTGNISGSGTLNKTNTGTWKQNGTSTHTGDLNIQQGILQVNGTLPSNINVQPAGVLAGTGTAGGNVTNNGIVKPGDENIGILTIAGNYVQTPNGTLDIELKPNGVSDQLIVKGTSTLDGRLNLKLLPGIYPKGDPHRIINANNIEGNFTSVSSNSSFRAGALITPNDFIITLDSEIIYPISNNKLPYNQKNVANYLFCDNFSFENTRLINLLNNLFALPLDKYIKALATLTPEHYGALPIGESRAIHYLLTQNIPTCTPNCPTTKHILTATPLYLTNHLQKHKTIPNYVQNSGGFRVNYAIAYPTAFESKASINYIHTHTNWGNHKGKADSNGVYLDLGIGYSIKGFLASLALLGGYSYTDATHNLNIGYPIKATSTPHSWDLAESLSLQYTHIYRCIAIIPRIVLTQTNVYLSSICEDKPKCLNLQTDAKYFGFLDTLVSMRIQGQKSHCYCCVKPYVDLGWHNSSHLSNREFHSKLDNYTACACSFSTKTYSGSTNRFFMEWGIAFSFMNNVDLLLNSRTEFAKGDFVQGVNLGASWRF